MAGLVTKNADGYVTITIPPNVARVLFPNEASEYDISELLNSIAEIREDILSLTDGYNSLNEKTTVQNLTNNVIFDTEAINTEASKYCYVYKVGRIVCIHGEFRVRTGSDIPAGVTKIASGLPQSTGTNSTQFVGQVSTTRDTCGLTVNESGELTTYYGGALPAGAAIRFDTTYISAS